MKKTRRIKIRLQTNELLIVRRDAHNAQNSSAAEDEQNSFVEVCPLCHSPLPGAPHLSRAIAAADSAKDANEL